MVPAHGLQEAAGRCWPGLPPPEGLPGPRAAAETAHSCGCGLEAPVLATGSSTGLPQCHHRGSWSPPQQVIPEGGTGRDRGREMDRGTSLCPGVRIHTLSHCHTVVIRRRHCVQPHAGGGTDPHFEEGCQRTGGHGLKPRHVSMQQDSTAAEMSREHSRGRQNAAVPRRLFRVGLRRCENKS